MVFFMLLFYFFILCLSCTTITPAQIPLQPILLALDCNNVENVFLPKSLNSSIVLDVLQALNNNNPPCIITNHHILRGIICLGTIMDGILNKQWDDTDFINNTKQLPNYNKIQYYDHLIYISVFIKDYLTCTTTQEITSFKENFKKIKADTQTVFNAQHTDREPIFLFLASYITLEKIKKSYIYKDEAFYYIMPDNTQESVLQNNNCNYIPFNNCSVQKTSAIQTISSLPLVLHHLLKNQNPDERIVLITGHGSHNLSQCASLNDANIKNILYHIPENSNVIIDTCENGGYHGAQLFNNNYPFHLFLRGGIEIMLTFGKSLLLHKLFSQLNNQPVIRINDSSWDMFKEKYSHYTNKIKGIFDCMPIVIPYDSKGEFIVNHIVSVKKPGHTMFEVVKTNEIGLIRHTQKTDYTIAQNSLIKCLVIEPIDFTQNIIIEITKMPFLMAFESKYKTVFRSINSINAQNILLKDIVESFFHLTETCHTRALYIKNITCSDGDFEDILCATKISIAKKSYTIFIYKNSITNSYHGIRQTYKEAILQLPQDLNEINQASFKNKHKILIRKLHRLTSPPRKTINKEILSSNKKQQPQ